MNTLWILMFYIPFESLIRISFDMFQRFLKKFEISEIYTGKGYSRICQTGLRRNYELRLRITAFFELRITNYDYENIGKNYELRK